MDNTLKQMERIFDTLSEEDKRVATILLCDITNALSPAESGTALKANQICVGGAVKLLYSLGRITPAAEVAAFQAFATSMRSDLKNAPPHVRDTFEQLFDETMSDFAMRASPEVEQVMRDALNRMKQ